jgi:hypothetical protein
MRVGPKEDRPKFEALLESKSELGELYASASSSGSITRRQLPDYLECQLTDPSALIVCLNWDTCFIEDRNFPNVIQLHGNCRHPRTLVLPTEYVMDFGKEDEATRHAWDLHDNELDMLRTCHSGAILFIKSVQSIYLWGVGLSIYDAEIQAILATAANEGKLDELRVINPDVCAGARAAAFLNRTEFIHLDPENEFTEKVVRKIDYLRDCRCSSN